MGFFKHNHRPEPPSTPDSAPGSAAGGAAEDGDYMSPVVELLRSRYPSATPEQLGFMSELIVNMEAKRGVPGSSWEPRQVAAVSTLCERLVSEDPHLGGFVAELRTIAAEASASNPGDVSWQAMVSHL